MTQQHKNTTLPTKDTKTEMTDTQKVTHYLQRNPDVLKKFIVENPDVLNKLTFPFEDNNGITNFYAFRAQKLQKELAHLKTRNRMLIQTSTENMQSQQQIHQLALDILAATSSQHLLETLRTYLNEHMGVDTTHLCVLENAPLAPNAHHKHQSVTQQTFDHIFAQTTDPVVLRTLYEADDKAIHGDWADDAASDALLRIQTPQDGIDMGFLALVSSQRDKFHPGQGAELLTFIANIIGHVMADWIAEETTAKNKTVQTQQKTG